MNQQSIQPRHDTRYECGDEDLEILYESWEDAHPGLRSGPAAT